MNVAVLAFAKDNGKSEAKQDDRENFLLSDRVNMPLNSPEMILQDLWPARTIGLFTGDGGVGKTHLALQLLVAIASGGKVPIQGIPLTCATPRDVVYITQEDEADFIRGELQCQFPQLKNQSHISNRIRIISTALKGEHLFLSDKRSRDYIADNLPEGSVFVLDSWATFLTSSENDNTELLRNEIAHLRNIMKARKATPLLIHHRPKRNSQTGIQSPFRGATALPNSCRFHMMLDNSGGGLRLSFEKVSRAATPDPIKLNFDPQHRIFVPAQTDKYVAAFKIHEELKTSEVMKKLGKDPRDKSERNKILDILRHRGEIKKVNKERMGIEAKWKRIK